LPSGFLPHSAHASGRAASGCAFSLLETIRQYADEHLCRHTSAEIHALRRAHLSYYVSLAEVGSSQLTGPGQLACLDRLEAELDNYRAALAFSTQDDCSADLGLRCGIALELFCHRRGLLGLECVGTLDYLLGIPALKCDATLRRWALVCLGALPV